MDETRKRKHHHRHKKSSRHDSDQERQHRKKKREDRSQERVEDENEVHRKQRMGDDSDEDSYNGRARHEDERYKKRIDDYDLKDVSTERVKHRADSKRHRKKWRDNPDSKDEYNNEKIDYNDDYQYKRYKKIKGGDGDSYSGKDRGKYEDRERYKTRKGDESGFKESYGKKEKYGDEKEHYKKRRNEDGSYEGGRGNYGDDNERYRTKKGDEADIRESHSAKKHHVGPRYYSSDIPEEKKQNKEDNEKSEENEIKEAVGPRYYSSGIPEEKKDNSNEKSEENEKKVAPDVITPAQKKTVDLLTSRTGGAYIPPAKLRMMQASITDKTSAAYQRIAWEALKKSIHGQINKVTTENIGIIVRELLRENIVRGRGLLCRSIIQAQAASPTFTNVYAALVSVINSKFPNIGELLLRRCVIQFRRGYKRNDKPICISAATFVAHLVNQRVAHEILALEILTLLVETPTEDSVEVAIAFLKECGSKLLEVSNKGMRSIFEMLRNILHEGKLSKKVQYMIEVMFQVWKDEFKDHKPVIEELDLVEEMEQFTHLITLDEATDGEDILNVYKYDPEYEANEEKYKALQREILGESDSGSGEEESGSEDDEDDDDDSDAPGGESSNKQTIIDNTETNLVALRKTIYLTIHSSLDFEECAHKLLRMELKPGQEIEMCHMFLDCCAEQRTYEKFFGLLAERFCQINKIYVSPFEQIFKDSYSTIHRVETNKLRNVAKLFAHLLHTDAISWEVLSTIRLNEEDTTSSSRIFIKILFLELSEFMGMFNLNQRVKDPSLQTALEGLFPHDNPKNTRFAINFFTSIGLGSLTDELREHLKAQPKQSSVPQLIEALSSTSSDSSSSSEDSSSSDDSSSSSSESEDSVQEIKKKKKKPASKVKSREKENGRKSTKNRSSKSVRDKRSNESSDSDHHSSKKNTEKKKSSSRDQSRNHSRHSSRDRSSSKHNSGRTRNKR